MPRVRELRPKYMTNQIGREINAKRVFRNMTQAELAEMVDMSQQNFSRKVKYNSFTYTDLIKLFSALKLSDDEILRLMKL